MSATSVRPARTALATMATAAITRGSCGLFQVSTCQNALVNIEYYIVHDPRLMILTPTIIPASGGPMRDERPQKARMPENAAEMFSGPTMSTSTGLEQPTTIPATIRFFYPLLAFRC